MPRVQVGHSPAFAAHLVDDTHMERPARNDAVVAARQRLGDRVGDYPFELASRAKLERIHHGPYLDELEATAGTTEPVVFDVDTSARAGSYETARLSAGSAIGAVDAVFTGGATRAFSLGRPPGHHAEVDRAMGFCFLNNIAIAAQHALDAHGCRRVAIVDWDVHHGNGTQRTFARRQDVLFVSSHQFRLFPGSGAHTDLGLGRGVGHTVNIPIGVEATDDEIYWLHRRITVPVLEAFEPDLLLISAGFDAHESDPVSGQRITARGFGRLGALLFDAADRLCQGRTVLVLEGGYDLAGLTDSIEAVLEAAIDPGPFLAEIPPEPREPLSTIIGRLTDGLAPYWPSLREPS